MVILQKGRPPGLLFVLVLSFEHPVRPVEKTFYIEVPSVSKLSYWQIFGLQDFFKNLRKFDLFLTNFYGGHLCWRALPFFIFQFI